MIKCDTCPRCKDIYPDKVDRDGNRFYICGMSGNIVYKAPRKIKRSSGSGYIYHDVSTCGVYETVNEALKDMAKSERVQSEHSKQQKNMADIRTLRR